MTHAVGFTPRKSFAEMNSVERNRVVTSGTVRVLVEGTGSGAGTGVAVPEAAAERDAGVAVLEGTGAGMRMSTVYAGVSDVGIKGAVRMAVWSTSS
jgi:hypothetical protein